MTTVRWAAAVAALAVAVVVAGGALTGTAGDRPAPIEVAASAVAGGDDGLRQVDPPRVQPTGPDTAGTVASATAADDPGAGSTTTPPGSPSTTLVPVPGTLTDPLDGLLAPLPLLGTTTTTAGPGSTSTTTTLLPGLPPLPLPPLPTLPLLPPLGG